MGQPASGKSTFFNQVVNNEFSDVYTQSAFLSFEIFEFNEEWIRIFDPPSANPDRIAPAQVLLDSGVVARYNFFNNYESPVIFLWFIDATDISNSVDYINAQAKYFNSSICFAEHYIVVSKIDLKDVSSQEVSISSQLHIKDIFHCSAKNKTGIDSLLNFLKEREAKVATPPSLKKIVLLGASSCGKTSLLKRYVWDSFDQNESATIGEVPYYMTLDTLSRPDVFYCRDFSGNNIFGHMFNVYFHKACTFLFCVDVSSRESIIAAAKYLIRLRCHSQLINKDQLFVSPGHMIFTKCDHLTSEQLQDGVHEIIKMANDPENILQVMNHLDKDDIKVEQKLDSPKCKISLKKTISIGKCKLNVLVPLPELNFNTEYFVTSAKMNTGIDDMFRTLAKRHFFHPAGIIRDLSVKHNFQLKDVRASSSVRKQSLEYAGHNSSTHDNRHTSFIRRISLFSNRSDDSKGNSTAKEDSSSRVPTVNY